MEDDVRNDSYAAVAFTMAVLAGGFALVMLITELVRIEDNETKGRHKTEIAR